MTIEAQSPSPDPDWQVVHRAQCAVRDIRWLVAAGYVTQGQAQPALDKLQEIIEAEIGKI